MLFLMYSASASDRTTLLHPASQTKRNWKTDTQINMLLGLRPFTTSLTWSLSLSLLLTEKHIKIQCLRETRLIITVRTKTLDSTRFVQYISVALPQCLSVANACGNWAGVMFMKHRVFIDQLTPLDMVVKCHKICPQHNAQGPVTLV